MQGGKKIIGAPVFQSKQNTQSNLMNTGLAKPVGRGEAVIEIRFFSFGVVQFLIVFMIGFLVHKHRMQSRIDQCFVFVLLQRLYFHRHIGKLLFQ